MTDTKSNQTLAERLSNQIRDHGPITFRDWMQSALYDKHQGYYCRSDLKRWGRKGDYRTSPERTTLFAATFARYFAKLIRDTGERFTIVEAGSGAGYVAEILLETLSRCFPDVYKKTNFILVELSASSREQTIERLSKFSERVQFQRLQELNPISYGIVFSNELLDAFPVHRVTFQGGELQEFYVDLNS